MHSLNHLTTQSRSGTLTVAGTTTSAATNVTVNGATASRYADNTFAKDGFSLTDGTNTFTAIAQDSYGRADTNTINAYLPSTINFVYDGNGNLRTNGTRILEYDDENQLIRITEPGAWKSEFTYDGKMRRRIRKEYTWQTDHWSLITEVRYIYDGNLPLQERHFAPQLSTSIPQQAITYTRGRDLSGSLEGAGGIGGLLARTENWKLITGDSSAHAYYHADGNGNITALVNDKQLIVAQYLYDPYGNELAVIGPLAAANLYRFSSKENHPTSALNYYGYRFYLPSLQRWVNRDPVQENGGISLYGFNWNSPLNQVDPHGQLPRVVVVGGGLVIIGGAVWSLCCLAHMGEIATQANGIVANVMGAWPPGYSTTAEGTPADALQHCIGACMANQNPGASCLWSSALVRRGIDAMENGGTPDDRNDLANNAVGYGITGNCRTGCLSALQSGRLSCFTTQRGLFRCPPPPAGQR
jgi:RHS repeat-associated protein